MDENTSQCSVDSEEYVVVNGEPKLRVTGDMADIGNEININELETEQTRTKRKDNGESCATGIRNSDTSDILQASEIPDLGQPEDCTIFDGITYIGCSAVNAPRSEAEIYRVMCVLNNQSQQVIPVTLCIPNSSDSIVRMMDPATKTDIRQYRIHRIMFFARGPSDSPENHCFAFTFSQGTCREDLMFQCHVFRCKIPEAVARIFTCFSATFRKTSKSPRPSSVSSVVESERLHIFTVSLEIKEDDGRGNFSTCPWVKNVFKFRCNWEKKIIINVQQNHNLVTVEPLHIERCFGLLISPGRNVRSADMQLIGMDSMGQTLDSRGYSVSGNWDPTESSFTVLNTETEKESRVFLTIAADLVIRGIQEPVRFAIETKAKVYPQNERFWYFTKRQQVEELHMKVKLMEGPESGDELKYVVESLTTRSSQDRHKPGLHIGPFSENYSQDIQSPMEDDVESDDDEPLMSGSCTVSKEVTDDNLIDAWNEVITRWQQQLNQRPPQVTKLARKGVPEALRGEVWQLLSNCANDSELLEAYRVLIIKESSSEQIIQRDIFRTFPAHEFFKESGGSGQESLYRISKAYSSYDEEIGYCQGISFLSAALLLHMPEEQAFCVLVKIMFEYELRELFSRDFEGLHLKFYQLERLMQDNLPDLYDHFLELNLEVHMFASQWFLTLYTAKFPLHMVYHILDIYLSEGKNVIFNVALALLKNARKELLALDFESVLKYFRVHLPKKYRAEEASRELLNAAISLKVSSKKLKKYQKDYVVIKEQDVDPVLRLETENKRLYDNVLRLEQENDELADEMITTKMSLTNRLEKAEKLVDSYKKEVVQLKSSLNDSEEEKKRLSEESNQLKEMCRRELERAEQENSRNSDIIADYKSICTQLSERLEKQQTVAKEEMFHVQERIGSCENCSKIFELDGKIKMPMFNVDQSKLNPQVIDLERQVRDLELELAKTKLALVESECKTQELTHQLSVSSNVSKNSWFQKTLSSLKDSKGNKKDGRIINPVTL